MEAGSGDRDIKKPSCKSEEKEIESIRMAAVGLTNEILDFKECGIDMRKEIVDYFHEKLEVSE